MLRGCPQDDAQCQMLCPLSKPEAQSLHQQHGPCKHSGYKNHHMGICMNRDIPRHWHVHEIAGKRAHTLPQPVADQLIMVGIGTFVTGLHFELSWPDRRSGRTTPEQKLKHSVCCQMQQVSNLILPAGLPAGRILVPL